MKPPTVTAGEMAAETDWFHIAVNGAIALGSGLVTALGIAFRSGRQGARAEQSVKDDYDAKFTALREKVSSEMAAHAEKADAGNDLLVSQFKESFEGIRRQHDDHKLDVERRFLLKDDFRDFREEYREDMRDLKASIAGISRTK